jgi:hypothetical protein
MAGAFGGACERRVYLLLREVLGLEECDAFLQRRARN